MLDFNDNIYNRGRDMDTLKDCPWCGGEPTMVWGAHKEMWGLICRPCNVLKAGQEKADAIEAWNKRVK